MLFCFMVCFVKNCGIIAVNFSHDSEKGTMTIESTEHDSRAVANRFVRLAQKKSDAITILQLVKLVYLAHGWYLGFHNKPLICHGVQAWKLGPVVPEVYHGFRPKDGVIVSALAMNGSEPYDSEFDERAISLIEGVFESYSPLSPFALSSLTHKPGTPWYQVKDNGFYAPISNTIIWQYYSKKVKEQNNK